METNDKCTKELKETFILNCKSGAAGNNKLPANRLDEYCECMYNKIKSMYNDPIIAFKNLTQADILRISEECYKDINEK